MGSGLVRPALLREKSRTEPERPRNRDPQGPPQLRVACGDTAGPRVHAGQERATEPERLNWLPLRGGRACKAGRSVMGDQQGFNGFRVAAFESRLATEMARLITRYGGQPPLGPPLPGGPPSNQNQGLPFRGGPPPPPVHNGDFP